MFALKALNFVLFGKKVFKLNSGTVKQHMFTIPPKKKNIFKSHFKVPRDKQFPELYTPCTVPSLFQF